MPKKILYSDVADSIVEGGWHWEVDDNVHLNNHIKSLTDSMKTVLLLADIAKSLRPLRCHNFLEVPERLRTIAREVREAQRKHEKLIQAQRREIAKYFLPRKRLKRTK